MLRRKDADRDFIRDIDRIADVTIDKQRVSDIPFRDVGSIGVHPSIPPPRDRYFTCFEPFPPSKITTGIVTGFKKVIPPVTDGVGVGDVGDVTLEERGKKISIYIIIGAVIIVGFLAMRRK